MKPDFPKVQCPFVRKTYEIDSGDWKKYGKRLGLRSPEVYLVTPEMNEQHEWVFDGEDTYAVEKLHGTNCCVEISDGRLVHVQNRMNEIDILKVVGKKDGLPPSARLLEGILNASQLGYLEDGEQYGELIGTRINGNLHKYNGHLFYPFNTARTSLLYRSFRTHPRTFNNFSEWFRLYLKSMLYCRMNKIPLGKIFGFLSCDDTVPFTEGVVFYKDGSEKTSMSKLRRDMYDWYYPNIHIKGLEHWRVDDANKFGYTLKGY